MPKGGVPVRQIAIRALLEGAGRPMTYGEIVAASTVSASATRNALYALVDRGAVVRAGGGYALAKS